MAPANRFDAQQVDMVGPSTSRRDLVPKLGRRAILRSCGWLGTVGEDTSPTHLPGPQTPRVSQLSPRAPDPGAEAFLA